MVSIRGRGSSDVESGDADDNHATEDQEATGSRGGEQAATLSLAELEVVLEAERRELVAQLVREHNMRNGS
jgi:hypothetical protein